MCTSLLVAAVRVKKEMEDMVLAIKVLKSFLIYLNGWFALNLALAHLHPHSQSHASYPTSPPGFRVEFSLPYGSGTLVLFLRLDYLLLPTAVVLLNV